MKSSSALEFLQMDIGERLPVTLADVAAAAGVSVATVSRVMGGSSHKVSQATRRLVEATAEGLGYKVNPIARALRLSTTGSIGMVVPSIRNPFFTEMVAQVEHNLAAHGLNLFLCDAQDSVELEARRLRSLSSGVVDGILIVPCHAVGSATAVRKAAQLVPLVQIDRHIPNLKIPWVGVEDTSGTREIMLHLAARGVSSLAVVTSTESSLSTAIRTDTVRNYAAELRITIAADQVIDGNYAVEEGAAAARRLAASGHLPDAVVCTDDILAIGVITGFREQGVRVPDDVLVTGFDDIQMAALVVPSLTTVRQPLSAMAAEAVRLLRNDRGEAQTGVRIALPGQLVERDSTNPARG